MGCVIDIELGYETRFYMTLNTVRRRTILKGGRKNAKMKCTPSNAYTLDLTVTSGVNVAEWHGVQTVLPTTHTFIHE